MVNNPSYSDVVFLLEDQKKVHAHKVVLASRSSYFRKLFEYQSSQKESNSVIPIESTHVKSFMVVLEFMYTDRVKLPEDYHLLQEVLQLAHKYELIPLQHQLLKGIAKRSPKEKHTLWNDIVSLCNNNTDNALWPKLDNANVPFSDVTLLVEGKTFYCHKCILSSRSWYFATLLGHQWRESNQNEICIQNVPFENVQVLLSFLYSNFIQIQTLQEALELHKMAQFFSIETLLYQCEQFISDIAIDYDTVCMLWNCTLQLGTETLQENCKSFFMKNFMECSNSSGFLELEKDLLKGALNGGEIDEDDAQMFEAVKKWCQYNATKLGMSFNEILLEMLPPRTLFNQRIKYAVLEAVDNLHDPILRMLLSGAN